MKPKLPRVIFVHSLNNYSGSPKVLQGVIRGFSPSEYRLRLFTSAGEGFLSDLPGVQRENNLYAWTRFRWLTAILLIVSQAYGFVRVLFLSRKDTVFYINTLIPFGVLLACKLTGKKNLVHIHEDIDNVKRLYRWCVWIVKCCADEVIFVSEYQRNKFGFNGKSHVVYNGIEMPEQATSKQLSTEKRLLMVASARVGKGIYQLPLLAKAFPDYAFELILSAGDREVKAYCEQIGVVPNLTVYSVQKSVSAFYDRATLLLQLSQASKFIETYGMTVVEAMAHGVPAVVPEIGGPKELVELTGCGVCCNTENVSDIVRVIELLLQDQQVYRLQSERCLEQAQRFSIEKMQMNIQQIVYEKRYS